MLPKSGGFTLVEVSVAVAVGLLVVGLAYGTYAFGARLVSRWEQRLYTQNTVHLITRRFTEDVRSAQAVAGVAPGRLALIGPARTRVVYRWEGAMLRRNGVRMHPKRVTVVQVVFRRVLPDAHIVMQHPKAALPVRGLPMRLALDLAVAAGEDTLRAGVQVTVRQPIAWLGGFPTGTDSYLP